MRIDRLLLLYDLRLKGNDHFHLSLYLIHKCSNFGDRLRGIEDHGKGQEKERDTGTLAVIG